MTCKGKFIAFKDKLSVLNCWTCGFAHLYPRPDTKNYYESDQFYGNYSPVGWLKKEVEEYQAGLWDSAYKYQLDLLSGKTSAIIDVGTGTGTFVDFCHKRDYPYAYGIEPSESARTVSPVKLGNMFYSPNGFDRRVRVYNRDDMDVRMSLVLEHIANPVEFIQRYQPYMGKTGKLMVITPSEFNPLQRRVSGNWFVSNVHINYFTPQSLQKTLESVGLRVIYVGATFPTELWVMAGLDHRKNPELGKRLHTLRMKMERRIGPRVYDWYKVLFDRWGWGREVVMVAEVCH